MLKNSHHGSQLQCKQCYINREQNDSSWPKESMMKGVGRTQYIDINKVYNETIFSGGGTKDNGHGKSVTIIVKDNFIEESKEAVLMQLSRCC